MKRSLFSILALLVIASMVLAACGATEAPAPTEAPAAEPTEAPAAEPTEAEEPSEPTTGEGVTITIAGGAVG
jgi:predicted small lipoprotein YifL